MFNWCRNIWVLAFCSILLMGATTRAQELIVQNRGGVSQAWMGDFGVTALITIDPDWMEKWNTPPETVPEFKGTDVLNFGQRAYLVTFFSGASAPDGEVNLTCDIAVTSVDGTVTQYPSNTCAKWPQPPNVAGSLFLTLLDISFMPDETFSDGTLKFTIGVTDENTGVRVPVTVLVEIDVGAAGS